MADEVKHPTNAGETPAAETPAASAAPAAPVAPQAPQARESRGPSGPRREGGGRPGGRDGGRKFFRRKKVCKFCVEKIDAIDYKDVRLLAQFVAERGKIVPRRLTGVCTPHQRRLSTAIKQARNIALLPFAARF
jgi:small subunit ribosomal protein S18